MGGIAIIISQHVLLLTSLYVIAGGIYIIAKATLEDSILVCTSLIIATVSVLSLNQVYGDDLICVGVSIYQLRGMS